MKSALEVCLVAFVATALALSSAAQSPALQQGISVELVPTHSASAMPDADNQDAFIVAVTQTGSVYLGINPISVDELSEKARTTPCWGCGAGFQPSGNPGSRASTHRAMKEPTGKVLTM